MPLENVDLNSDFYGKIFELFTNYVYNKISEDYLPIMLDYNYHEYKEYTDDPLEILLVFYFSDLKNNYQISITHHTYSSDYKFIFRNFNTHSQEHCLKGQCFYVFVSIDS